MIYVITHKKFDDSIIDKKHYLILHVGPNDNSKKEYLRDDVKDNISYKNLSYCELTGLYWIWKNDKSDSNTITGLVHYRRFFTSKREDILYTYFDMHPNQISFSVIEKTLQKYDIILPTPVTIYRTVSQFYSDIHNGQDLKLTREVIKEVAPDYLKDFDKVLNHTHYFYYGNMMICKKYVLDNYCEWLFNILSNLEPKINIDKYDDYQKRVFGFISERLLQVWVLHNNLNIKKYPVFNTEEKRLTVFKKNYNRIKKILG